MFSINLLKWRQYAFTSDVKIINLFSDENIMLSWLVINAFWVGRHCVVNVHSLEGREMQNVLLLLDLFVYVSDCNVKENTLIVFYFFGILEFTEST